jgi:23S rRNA (uracil1939-C5)-methyltransferase
VEADTPAAGPDEEITLDISALSNGRDGLGRHEGKVVFVPGVAPGDRVRARISERHSSYARATLLAVESAGPARRTPPCPWVDRCGGCAWQHVAYDAQLAAKTRNVRDALARIGGLEAARELPIIAAPAEWAYRRRIRLHVDPGGRLGYRAARSRELVEIEACAIADPAIDTALAPLRHALPTLRTRLSDVELVANGRGTVVLVLSARGPLRPHDGVTLRALLDTAPEITGIIVRGRGWQRRLGDLRVRIQPEADGPTVTQTAGTFSQVNDGANQLLVAAVVAMAAPATRAVDLYCGTGNLSLPLARAGLTVHGFDRDRLAIADARSSARHVGLAARAHFTADDAVSALARPEVQGIDLLILDPPRTGAPGVVGALADHRPPRILYVSCDPATLARDARTLATAGYRVDRVQVVDLFPQTEHVETILEAVLTDP